MSTPAGRRLWILGAGFSKALGGPLIPDLLAMRELRVLRSLFPAKTFPGVADEQFKARLYFKHGLDRRYWDHAEQFLDLVESAVAETGSARSHGGTLLQSMLKGTVRNTTTAVMAGPTYDYGSIDELASACRRALAVDCSIFLRSAQLNSERWSPYVEWAKGLSAFDSVITFNYDHVPELLAAESKTFRVVDPNNTAEDLEEAQKLRVATVLKIHGSVTWRRDGKKIDVMNIDDPALGDPRTDVVIGVPGPGKRAVYRESLDRMRHAAISAIRDARLLVFLGYRFPPTDADARRDLLESIRHINHPEAEVLIETVLGPLVNGPDSIRLLHLLRQVTGAQVRSVPLLAEDYLALRGITGFE